MTIEVPNWCRIGKYIEFKMYNPDTGKMDWFKDRIISYSENGFFHKAHNCPVYHNRFDDYGDTVREVEC